MIQYPAYPKYKPTGCEWFPAIPEHWGIERAKWSVTACQNGVWGAEPDGDDDLVCIRVADFNRQSLWVSTKKLTMRSIAEKDRRNRLLEAGDSSFSKSPAVVSNSWLAPWSSSINPSLPSVQIS